MAMFDFMKVAHLKNFTYSNPRPYIPLNLMIGKFNEPLECLWKPNVIHSVNLTLTAARKDIVVSVPLELVDKIVHPTNCLIIPKATLTLCGPTQLQDLLASTSLTKKLIEGSIDFKGSFRSNKYIFEMVKERKTTVNV